MTTLPPFGDVLGKLQAMKSKMDDVMKRAAARTASATVGGGMVTATANGQQQLVRVKLDKSALETGDIQMIEDLIVAACNQALNETKGFVQEETQKIVTELGVALPPGFDLTKLFPGA